jgi:hypothetical protein
LILQTQSNTTSAVSRARKWRYHTAVQAARVLNAAAGRQHDILRPGDGSQQPSLTGRTAAPAR